jgi:hypothetical protein
MLATTNQMTSRDAQIVSTGAFPLRARVEHLTEVRVKLQLQVRVWGMDTNGKPFSVSAETIEISGLGARLRGVPNLQEGDIVGIQYANQKARFRVVWIGRPGTDHSEEVGVKSLDGSAYIWAAALEQHKLETANRAMAGSNPHATSAGAKSRCQPGMGIGFIPDDPEQRRQLAHMMNEVGGPAIPAETELSISAPPPPASLEARMDVLVTLLEKRGLISREELLAELKKHNPFLRRF